MCTHDPIFKCPSGKYTAGTKPSACITWKGKTICSWIQWQGEEVKIHAMVKYIAFLFENDISDELLVSTNTTNTIMYMVYTYRSRAIEGPVLELAICRN